MSLIFVVPEGALPFDEDLLADERGLVFEAGLWAYLDPIGGYANEAGHLRIGREGQESWVYECVLTLQVLDGALTMGQLNEYAREWGEFHQSAVVRAQYHPGQGIVTLYAIQVS